MKLSEEFLYAVYSAVEEIPRGKVMTYGQIAKTIGYDKNSRLIGKALSMAGLYGDYPCHRVVNHQGRLTPGWHAQKRLLQEEGIEFSKNENINLKKHLYEP